MTTKKPLNRNKSTLFFLKKNLWSQNCQVLTQFCEQSVTNNFFFRICKWIFQKGHFFCPFLIFANTFQKKK